MIGAILQIILAIPYGVFIDREKPKLTIGYLFVLIALFGILSVAIPEKTLEVVATTTLPEYIIALVRTFTGAGIGFIISAISRKLWP